MNFKTKTMKQTIELQKMRLVPITEFETQDIDGGKAGSFWVWLAKEIINNWDDFTKGVKDGWSSVHYDK